MKETREIVRLRGRRRRGPGLRDAAPNMNQISTIDRKYGLGHTAANDWTIYDGNGSNAQLVARGQGSHVQGGDWISSIVIVFENERFKGSTLQVMGRSFGAVDWAIVGGTGHFALASGLITLVQAAVGYNNNVQQLTIEGFCPVFQGGSPIPIPAEKSEQFGGDGGKEFDIPNPPQSLISVTVGSGDVIDSLAFTYVDEAGKEKTAGPWGGNGGLSKTIVLAPTETVTKIYGTTDNFGGHVVVTSLNIVTNLGKIETFGKKTGGTTFSIPKNNNNIAVGFLGRGGLFLDAIGVYEVPSTAL